MLKENEPTQKANDNEVSCNLPKGLKFIEVCYLAFIALTILAFTAKFTLGFHSGIETDKLIFKCAISIGIYYGIKKVKRWVVILILLFSYWGVMISVLNFLTNYTDPLQLVVARFMNTLFLCFYVYQLLIFTKKETKKYFKVKGKLII